VDCVAKEEGIKRKEFEPACDYLC